jgi:hypothetical protein
MKKIALTAVALASLGLVACQARTNENGSTTITTNANLPELGNDIGAAAGNITESAGNALSQAGDSISNAASSASNEVSQAGSNASNATRNEVRDEARDADAATNKATR